MNLHVCLVAVLGFPVATVCILSLPLILLGVIEPDPRPWNWLTVYIVDVLFGLALFAQLLGLLRRSAHSRLWTAAVGGYTTLAFGQSALEALLDFCGVQPAPIVAKAPIALFMSVGVLLGVLLLLLAVRGGQYWTGHPARQEKQ